jgi:hypothetical protein
MKENVGRIMGIALFLLILLAVLGPCLSTGPPPIDPKVIGWQLEDEAP